jgi:hypothetical protein
MPLKNSWHFKKLYQSLLEVLIPAMRKNMMSFFLVLREVLEQSMLPQEVSLLVSLEIWSVLKELSQSVRIQFLNNFLSFGVI